MAPSASRVGFARNAVSLMGTESKLPSGTTCKQYPVAKAASIAFSGDFLTFSSQDFIFRDALFFKSSTLDGFAEIVLVGSFMITRI